MKLYKNIFLLAIFTILYFVFTSCGSSYPVTTTPQYSNPAWAPASTNGVRYYYLPDIESYYDLSNNDFVYMNDGQWQFSNTIPPMYNNYNLYNGFTVSLNNTVYQPWMHHQQYVANYPPYYYRNKYQGNQYNGIRGFNENIRQPVFVHPPENNRQNEQTNNRPLNTTPSRPSQNPQYRGRNIGQPVQVRPYMRQNRAENNAGNKRSGSNIERPAKKQ